MFHRYWEESIICSLGRVFFRCWLLYSIVQVFHFFMLIFCLVVLSVVESGDVIVSNCCWIVYFSLLFCQFLLHVFWASVIRCICVYSCYVFPTDWTFYHYKMSIFISTNIFVLKSILSNISITTPTFLWLLFACYTFFHSFIFSLFISFQSRESPIHLWRGQNRGKATGLLMALRTGEPLNHRQVLTGELEQ